MTVDHSHVGDHAAVGVVHGVEDHGAGGSVRVAHRVRDLLHDAVEQFVHTDSGLAGDLENVVRRPADEVGEFLRVFLGVSGRKVDLVEDGDDLEVVLHRQVQVGEGLRLDALGSVDEEDRTLTGGQ